MAEVFAEARLDGCRLLGHDLRRGDIKADIRHLGTDVDVQTGKRDVVRLRLGNLQTAGDLIFHHAELRARRAGLDARRRPAFDMGHRTQRDIGPHAQRPCYLDNAFELVDRVHVDRLDRRVQRIRDLLPGLGDTIEHHAIGGEAGMFGLGDLAAGVNLDRHPLLRHQAKHGEVGAGLARKTHARILMVIAKRRVQPPGVAAQPLLGKDEQRRAVLFGDPHQINAIHMQVTATILQETGFGPRIQVECVFHCRPPFGVAAGHGRYGGAGEPDG